MDNNQNVNDLFDDAAGDGTLSPVTVNALQVVDIGAEIQKGMGVLAEEIAASDVTLVGLLLDDSGSMDSNQDAAIDGHNIVLDAVGSSTNKDGILLHTAFLNDPPLNPFNSLDRVQRLSRRNYRPVHGTPLYDASFVFLGTVLAKAQEFANNGVPVRTISCIVSDGMDMDSHKDASDVARLVADMRRAETHIIAAIGIGQDEKAFRRVFSSMGIDDRWILTIANTEADIRQAFQMVSQASKQASQGAQAFSKTALGGFAG